MGQSKGGGYEKLPTLSPQQQQLSNQYLGQAFPWQQQAAQGYQQFLPGGGGGQPIIDAALQRYKQQTIPSILNAFGSDNKGSSALNHALAASASNLNTDLGSQLALLQLQAAGGLGSMGQNIGAQGLNRDTFAYMPQQSPLWQKLLGAGIGGTGGAIGGGLTGGPWGAVAGGLSGAGQGFAGMGY